MNLRQHIILPAISGGSYAQETNKEVRLNQLATFNYVQDYGIPRLNKTVYLTPITVNGVTYEEALGTHSISRMLFELEGKATSISGMVAATDISEFPGKIQFKIIGDRKELWKSGIMKKGDPVKEFDVNLSNIGKVLLLVEECGDGIMYDHAAWIKVKFNTSGTIKPIPACPAPIRKEKYILTPKAPDTPQINNPLVYGARPGNAFMMNIMATGKRPMSYTAEGLPRGLKLDPSTGFITGKTNAKGDFKVVLKATNNLGTVQKEILLKMGKDIALTPPMGWNSWNCWGLSVDDQKVRDAAKMMSERLHDYGWTYINIDDGWQGDERAKSGEIQSNRTFPNFKALTDFIHSKGLKFGIYSSPGPQTCGRHLGSYQHELQDAKTWEKWGVDYLKYDYCSYTEVQKDNSEKSIQEPYIVMRKALDKIKRDIVYCVGYGTFNVWNWGKAAGGNQWRTTRDIVDQWNVVLAIGSFQDVCAYTSEPGKYNDPDMLVVGKLGRGWGAKVHDSYLTPDEQYSHISLWSILSAPMLIGCDMTQMDDFTMNLLTNTEVIAVDQDPLVAPATKAFTKEGQIWYKKLVDGSYAVGFFHMDPYFILWDQDQAESIQEKEYDFELDLKQLGISGKAKVRDLWRQKDLGEFNTSYQTRVPYHGVKFVKITPL